MWHGAEQLRPILTAALLCAATLIVPAPLLTQATMLWRAGLFRSTMGWSRVA